MRVVKSLPDVLAVPVGTQVQCGSRTYVKASSGRWSVVLNKALLAEVRKCYVIQGMTLRETKAALRIEGMPTINVQRVLEDNEWMRSHYGRNAARDKWYAENRNVILQAHVKFGVDLRTIEEWSGVPLGVRLMREGLKSRRSGRTETKASSTASGWLSREQVSSWNYYLSLDHNAISFQQYRKAVANLSFLALRKARTIKAPNEHLDHKLSRYLGFYTKDSYPVPGKFMSVKRHKVIPIGYMAHPANLRIVPSSVNCKKRHKSILSPTQLKHLVTKLGGPLKPIDYPTEVCLLMRKLGAKPYKGD